MVNRNSDAMEWKRYFILSALFVITLSVYAQNTIEIFDDLTYQWDKEAEKLSTYDGLLEFCQNDDYRYATIDILRGIHHYDSVLYKNLKVAQRRDRHNHDINKTIKEIENFERNYTTKNFIHFLHGDCDRSTELEKQSTALRKDSGEGSYDNQVYVLEVELGRYVHHVTKKVDQIRNLTHHLYD